MKKFLSFAVLVLLTMSVACYSESPKITVNLITDYAGIDDKSFNFAIWNGILSFYNESWNNQKSRDILYTVTPCGTKDDYVPVLKEACQKGYDLIIVPGFGFSESISLVADEFPGQKFAVIDSSDVKKENVMNFVFHEEEGAYLVGALCALQAKLDGITNAKFGFIGGIPGSLITKFEMGYIQGIKSVLPNASVVDFYTDSWNKPLLAREKAEQWFDTGVYAVFSAAKQKRLAGENVWAIGVDSDQYEEGLYSGTKSAVLTSMVKRVDVAAITALKCTGENSFKSGVITLSLKDKGVDFSKSNPELTPAVIHQVEKIKQNIIAGKIKIYTEYSEAKKAGVAPAGLSAKDK
ncbi:MAG: BMP family protein [Treponema sp.]